MGDLELFDDLFYPGSTRKRREKMRDTGFVAEDWRSQGNDKMLNGKTVRMYPIGALAAALGVSVAAIRKWIANGHIPQAPYRLPSNMKLHGQTVAGRRLYTEEMIDSVVQIFEEEDLLGTSRILWSKHPEVSIRIMEAWNDLLKNNTTDNNSEEQVR